MNTERIKKVIRPYFIRWYERPRIERHHEALIRDIKDRGYANVVFFACNVAMWHHQNVYNIFQADSRFRVWIILQPLNEHKTTKENNGMMALRQFFDKMGVSYLDATDWNEEQCDLSKTIKPDILFYPQPYSHIFRNGLDWENYKDKLLCYLPYDAGTVTEWWSSNTAFQNRAWKLFYQTEFNRDEARRFMYIKGKNVAVVGNADADTFIEENHQDVWKPQETPKKRIIWAPHWQIATGGVMHRASFLWLNEEMPRLARTYSDSIQFAFKPHPWLKSQLYAHPEWGKERTDAYYSMWSDMPNGQLEEGEYVNLFMTSNAMIHDCGGFTIYYHFSRKPVLFTSRSFEQARSQLNDYGKSALDAHYVGKDNADIERFISEIVIGDKDPKRAEREDFYAKYLLPPHGKTTAQAVYDEIANALFG